jgi:hypothetical protein
VEEVGIFSGHMLMHALLSALILKVLKKEFQRLDMGFLEAKKKWQLNVQLFLISYNNVRIHLNVNIFYNRHDHHLI